MQLRTVVLFALLAVLLLPLLPTGPAGAATPLGGLAVAVTPDGSRLVAGGDSSALYELDPVTLAVKRRGHVGRQVVDLAFTPDGKQLLVETTDALLWVAADTFEVVNTIEEVERMSVAGAAGLAAVRATKGNAIRVLSVADGAEKAAIPYDRMKSIAAFGLKQDGSKLAILYYRKQDPEEAKVDRKEIPADLKDAALAEFTQKHDGYTAEYAVHEVATGKAVLEKKLWYGAPGGGNRLYWHGEDVLVVSYENQNARIDPAGEATYFELGNSYNYGMAASADGAVLLTGGLRAASRTTTDKLAGSAFKLDELPGFPEYLKGFAFAADGTGFAGTSRWRVARLKPDATIEKVAPVF
jgi:hypothetical protein